SNGDITSLKFNGVEAQDSSKFSQISSGLGSASCSWVRTGNDDNYILITCTTSTLTQYYVARYKDPAVHMATYTTAEPSVGELRFIARLNKDVLYSGYTVSDVEDGTAIEGSDVFLVDGQTRSKFYSSRQFIDDSIHGVTGSSIGAYMIVTTTGYESSSGGPFFRDIDNQGSSQQELYFCKTHVIFVADMTYHQNSGHTQTESYRQGLHGPYALWFTTGSAPSSSIDTTFWEALGISGYVAKAARGYVIGKAIDVPSAFASLVSVGWSNSEAQYWARADSSTQDFSSPPMKPGTFTMTLYKTELAVGSQSVSVSAGSTTTSNIHSTADPTPSSPIWQIGDFDGTPRGFLNADMIETMHPSDSRMHDWLRTYTVGQQDIGYFPMAVFKDVGPVTVRFALASGQGGARTLVIGTTLAFAGGRPSVTINGWSGPAPAAPSQPDSRGVTRGTWRGNNILYTVSIPSGTLYTGSTVNVLTIYAISGSSGTDYLSPNFVVDALALY
ncbi:polysaccharide lyase family 4 protein, partial [Punctularia strigosozonata HHB-11173 SS5]|uniref:polysaccharide lyase family 4 protein n=1 Tax=Punctularia strigosozonata (strain HHB-11173) TaxID=741275 RepID=UPI000441770C